MQRLKTGETMPNKKWTDADIEALQLFIKSKSGDPNAMQLLSMNWCELIPQVKQHFLELAKRLRPEEAE
jgi:hypothetical protein